MAKFLFIFIIFLAGLLYFPAQTLAASVFISTSGTARVGDTFEVLINADTDGEAVNSVNLSLDYDDNLISFAGYKSENTVIELWVDSPHEEDGVLYMGGIIPGGVSGLYDPSKNGLSPIPLARLLFVAKAEGNAKLSFVKTEILKHDGRGSQLVHDEKNGEIMIKSASPEGILGKGENIFDKNSPEPFSLIFLESSLFSETPSIIIFHAQDIDSGIKEYKMKINEGEWKEAKSPQHVSKNIFSRGITIRAVDFYGNFQDASLTVPGFVPFKLLLTIFALLIIAGVFGFKVVKHMV